MMSLDQLAQQLEKRSRDLDMEYCRLEVTYDGRFRSYEIRLVDVGPAGVGVSAMKTVTRNRCVTEHEVSHSFMNPIVLAANELLAEGEPLRPVQTVGGG